MERHQRDIGALLAGQDFASIEEANAFLETHVRGRVPEPARLETASARAQDLVYDAWETSSTGLKRKLAQDAIGIDPDCADALVLLGELAEDPAEARAYFERATEAGARSLGEGFFEENAGHFWGMLETRGYMRARFALAQEMWDSGEEEAAIGHAEALLELNPHDNQGVRDVLVGWLLARDETSKAARLIREYETDGSAVMAWARVIQCFQAFGPTEAADDALDEALSTNPAALLYLLGVKDAPDDVPDTYAIGGEDEAVLVDDLLAEAWMNTPGIAEWAVDFLDREVAERERRKKGRPFGS